jgi:MYXO-CTERM domain-containing protein
MTAMAPNPIASARNAGARPNEIRRIKIALKCVPSISSRSTPMMSRWGRFPVVVASLTLALLLVPETARATYSIVATDSMTGQVGGAVTSCVGAQGVGVVYRPSVGHGAVNAQASANATGRDRAVVLMGMDVAPADIITMITASAFDPNADTRQYGIVDLMGRAAGFTGSGAMDYKEDRQNTWGRYTYSIQGNILTGKAVLDQAEMGFQNGGCDLADKLMLAIEAGALNSQGDSRCTPRGIPSDAASLEVDLAGATAGSWLKLDIAGTGNMSAVTQLRTMFTAWRSSHPCNSNPGTGGMGGAGGTSGAGGRGGSGVVGTGGAADGRGGTTGAGGAAGMNGTGGTSGNAGTTGSGGTTGTVGTTTGGGGCSCAVGTPGWPPYALLLALGFLRPRRRR